jgi:hypothetical protein
MVVPLSLSAHSLAPSALGLSVCLARSLLSLSPDRCTCVPVIPTQTKQCRAGLRRCDCLSLFNHRCSRDWHSITRRLGLKQIKCLDQLGWLGWVLLEHQLLDISLEGVLAVLHQLGESVRVLETVCIQLHHIDRIHLLHVLSQSRQLALIQLVGITRYVRALRHELESLLLFLSFETLTFRLQDAPHH